MCTAILVRQCDDPCMRCTAFHAFSLSSRLDSCLFRTARLAARVCPVHHFLTSTLAPPCSLTLAIEDVPLPSMRTSCNRLAPSRSPVDSNACDMSLARSGLAVCEMFITFGICFDLWCLLPSMSVEQMLGQRDLAMPSDVFAMYNGKLIRKVPSCPIDLAGFQTLVGLCTPVVSNTAIVEN